MLFALVTTTINVPKNLEAYVRDLADHAPSDTIVVVAGDKKTPQETEDLCAHLASTYGIKIYYLSPEAQSALDKNYSDFLGWNTIQRRNMAILFAYKQGAETIITIDDDNFLTTPDYCAKHTLTTQRVHAVHSTNGWYNICSRLDSEDRFYPRGYSVRERGMYGTPIKYTFDTRHCVVNAGLWVGDPDIDAVTRLALNPTVVAAATSKISLGKKVYCPFNSQNTALHRSVIPAYCMVSGVGRYDDIIPSFFVKRIADHLGDAIQFGEPIVRQERNAHDLYRDFDQERMGMQLTDRLVDWLRLLELKGTTYGACAKEIVDALETLSPRDTAVMSDWHEALFFRNVVDSYRAWEQAL